MNSLDSGVVVQGVLAELATDSGLLVASEGNLGVELVVAVHPDGSGVELVGGGDGTADVPGEDS